MSVNPDPQDPIHSSELTVSDLHFARFLQQGSANLGQPGQLPPGVPKKLGQYTLNRYIGGGGFGIVFEAFDEVLQRVVAIKLPRSHVSCSPELSARFLDEARAVAKLTHPGIVNPLEAGSENDQPFIVYPYCTGPNLAELASSLTTPLSPRHTAELILKLTESVAYSHQLGVLHRDIKPANVLLFPKQQSDKSSLPFDPKLTDFGLAKLIDEDQSATGSSVVLGTPLYLSPEQVSGGEVSMRTDVYALGLLLYELLTGQRPFQAENLLYLLQIIRTEAPIPPKKIRPLLPDDLNLICLKCLEKNPDDRYASAKELADDLRRFLQGEKIHAQAPAFSTLLQRWAESPARHYEIGFLSIIVGISLPIWATILVVLIRSGGLGHISLTAHMINTVALTTFVALPLTVCGYATIRHSRLANLGGMITNAIGLIVALLALTEIYIVYEEIYGPQPVMKLMAFFTLGTIFALLGIGYANLFWQTRPQKGLTLYRFGQTRFGTTTVSAQVPLTTTRIALGPTNPPSPPDPARSPE